MISHLLNIVYGIVFGVANVIPGVSGGTMMVVFGVYDKVVDVLTLKLSAIKKNIRFIVFFGIGAVIGILGFSFVIMWQRICSLWDLSSAVSRLFTGI